MRTIQFNVYQFDELKDFAKEQAIKSLKQTAFECYAEGEWEDANRTIERVEEMTHVKCDIQQSSQGFYYRWATTDLSPLDDEDERKRFEMFKKDIMVQESQSWADDLMEKVFDNAVFNNKHSYEGNIARQLVRFCDEVYLNTMDFFDDETTIEYIYDNDIEFNEDGKPYYA